MMDGTVPWRCLVPADAVAFLIGKGGANIRELGETSGCRVAISKEGETPSTLADKIISFSGLVEQKGHACGMVLRKLRQMQGVMDHEPGVFVIIIPQISAPVIIGSKGAQIKAIMEQSGAEINVGRESIIGMPDQPISINGTLDQVVHAVSMMNSVLQDMADRGKLMDKDFVYKSHEAPVLDRGRGGMDGPSQAAAPATSANNEDLDHPSGPTPSNLGSATAPPPAANGALSGACGGGSAFGDGCPSAPGNSLGGSGACFGGVSAMSNGPSPSSGTTGMSFGAGPPINQSSSQNQAAHQAGQGSSCSTSLSPAGQSPQQNQQTSFSQGGGGATSFVQSGQMQQGQGTTASMSFGPSGQTCASSFGPGGSTHSFGSQALSSFSPTVNTGNSFGPNSSSFGNGMGPTGNMGAGMNSGMGGMGNMGPMGSMGSMGGLGMGMGGLGGMGMNNPMAMGGMGMGMNGMGNPMLGGMGMSNPMLSNIGNSPNERAFLNALQSSGINNAQLTLLIPQALVQNILIPRGIMAEIAQRSGSQIDLGLESPPGMRQVTVSGTMVSNALASLFLQEKVIQFQQMS